MAYESGRFADIDDETILDARTPHDVAAIVDRMSADLSQHPDEWDNHTLERFLDASPGCLADSTSFTATEVRSCQTRRPGRSLPRPSS